MGKTYFHEQIMRPPSSLREGAFLKTADALLQAISPQGARQNAVCRMGTDPGHRRGWRSRGCGRRAAPRPSRIAPRLLGRRHCCGTAGRMLLALVPPTVNAQATSLHLAGIGGMRDRGCACSQHPRPRRPASAGRRDARAGWHQPVGIPGLQSGAVLARVSLAVCNRVIALPERRFRRLAGSTARPGGAAARSLDRRGTPVLGAVPLSHCLSDEPSDSIARARYPRVRIAIAAAEARVSTPSLA